MTQFKRVPYEQSAAAARLRDPETQKKLDEMTACLMTDSDGWEGTPTPALPVDISASKVAREIVRKNIQRPMI